MGPGARRQPEERLPLRSNAAWPHLEARGGGAILSTASIAGLWAIPADAAYCASKAGVIMLTKCLALDGARQGIRANCVCPGYTQTPMIDGYFDAQPDPERPRATSRPACTRSGGSGNRATTRMRSCTWPPTRRRG